MGSETSPILITRDFIDLYLDFDVSCDWRKPPSLLARPSVADEQGEFDPSGIDLHSAASLLIVGD